MADGMGMYRSTIRSATRGLWSGAMDWEQFYELMLDTVRLGFEAAWHEGAAECGILPEDLTAEERQALQSATVQENGYIAGFADTIEEKSKANGGKLGPLLVRAELWVKRYNDLRNRAKEMACGDQKLKWKMHPEKEHCKSCLKLNGKVKRASVWRNNDVRPQHPTKLECMVGAGGPSVCGCEFVVTDEPCSRGPLPNLP